MRHSTLLLLTFIFMMIPAFAEAKTAISVAKFEDKTSLSHCQETPGARLNADSKIREQLIAQLMELRRFQIQEREIRPLKPIHALAGTVKLFEVCQQGRKGQSVRIEIDVKMTSKSGLVRTFTSSAMASNTMAGLAPAQAIRAAVGEVVRRIDEAVPRYRQARLPIKRSRRVIAENDVQVKMYRKSNR